MMIRIRPSEERGHANHGWLDTYHTFSFNTYYDENHMGFRVLRVLNEDRVQPGQGFGTHPHRDMEILTYVLEGALEHRDSMGHGSVIRPGDMQRMSAGTGVLHSEFNPSRSEPVHFLQIWLQPQLRGIEPGYEQKDFDLDVSGGRPCLIASPDGRDGSLTIHQDARVYAVKPKPGQGISVPVESDRHIWLHVARGMLKLNDKLLKQGDGAAISNEPWIRLAGQDSTEALLFDLP
jgi:redox-sensitive bicupin YhaK (pirin superfamily)